MADRYGDDVLGGGRGSWRRPREVPELPVEAGLVVEHLDSGWCGAVSSHDKTGVTLTDRKGRSRAFPWGRAAYAVDGSLVTLVPPRPRAPTKRARTASGSLAVPAQPARVARAGRIYVEGVHDAALVERVWGDDLRVEGVVVEPLHGIDDLPAVVRGFRPGPARRLGVLVDHLVRGSKESRIVASARSEHVCVTGHPYVDVWQAVRPASVGIRGWPDVPKDVPWKQGVVRALGLGQGLEAEQEMWRRILGSVRTYADLETPLLRAVEELIDFVTAPE